MNCWFEASTTDSFDLSQLAALHDGLGFLPGSACPHYDGEEQRRPLYRRLIAEEGFPPGYAADDAAALVFDGTELREVVTTAGGLDRLPRRRRRRARRCRRGCSSERSRRAHAADAALPLGAEHRLRSWLRRRPWLPRALAVRRSVTERVAMRAKRGGAARHHRPAGAHPHAQPTRCGGGVAESGRAPEAVLAQVRGDGRSRGRAVNGRGGRRRPRASARGRAPR